MAKRPLDLPAHLRLDDVLKGRGPLLLAVEVPTQSLERIAVGRHIRAALTRLQLRDYDLDEARTATGNTMELLKAENLTQTVEALQTLTSGGEPPRC